MNMKRLCALTIAASMALSAVPVFASTIEDPNGYGTVTVNADGSTMLNFGNNSITQSGKGSIITDSAYGVLRPDNLQGKDNVAILTMPSIDLNGTSYDKVDILAACKNDVAVSLKVGGVEVATFTAVNNGSWDSFSTNTSDLTTTAASGNVTMEITHISGNKYSGNYIYVKFYDSDAPAVTPDPNATAAPTKVPATPAPTEVPEGLLPYQDTSLSFEERAADLVSRMTLEEKVTQLGKDAPAIDRLGVKAYSWWKECLHGVARQGVATNFPAPLALSNTWNRDLVYRVADITSTEARGKNNRYNLSYYTPTVNMARDPRWGRNDETYGEDPYLTGELGGQFVKGMQGDDEKYTKIIATIKHFAANNNEANRRGGSSLMSEFNLRNYYAKVFQNVTEIEMPGSVMSSYNATTVYRNGELLYNYLPSAANSYLLTDLLRRNWGFEGYVTTDCGTGEDLVKNAAYKQAILGTTSADAGEYIAEAIMAGMDLECNLGGGNMSATYGAEAVASGYLTEEQLETAIYHLFLQRFRTGEFDDTSSYRNITAAVIETDANVAVAEEAAEESWVLLKNDDNILPATSAKNVAVIGNMANTLALGDYAGSPTKNTTPIEGMTKEFAKQGATVNYLGAVSENEKLFNVKSITLVLKDGKTRSVDLTKAESVKGMLLSNGTFVDVTPLSTAVIKGVNFLDVASVRVEMATGSQMGGSLNIAYGNGGPTVAAVESQPTSSTSTYVVCEAEYTGEDGGYNGTEDMYISASPAVAPFSVEAYKAELDAADVIIAYAGTVPKQDGFGEADSSESNDRESIDLPSHQSHVLEITAAYPEKTVVVMSTVGQINVEPFMDNAKAILWTSYNGQTQGEALGKVLTGQVNPSGKLSTTWYKNADLQKMELANRSKQTIDGIEGYYTDYNIQPTDKQPGRTYQYYTGTPVYPFGYGLSYTNYEYSNMTASVVGAETAAVSEAVSNGVISYNNGVVEISTGKTEKAVLVKAAYADGKLVSVTSTPVELKENEVTTVNVTANDGDKFMLWNSVNGMTPISQALTVVEESTSVDANGQMKFTVDVTNTGSVAGKEVVQLYISHPQTDANTPDKQLKGFEKVELAAGETKTVEFVLDVADVALYQEAAEKLVVTEGAYTAVIGKNAADTANSKKFNVTGTLASTLKTVKAMPDGVTVNGLVCEDGTELESKTEIVSRVSAVMTDEVRYNLADATVEYTSSNEDVATVNEKGVVVSGTTEGVATITVSITIDGTTKTDSFPVVNKLLVKPSTADIEAAKAAIKAEYDKLPKTAYTDANLAEIEKIYSNALIKFELITTKDDLTVALAKAVNDLNSVVMDKLTESYTIESVNPVHIEKGMIDYREGGIPMYSGAVGTITESNPYSPIALVAKDADGNTIDASKLTWQVKKFDDSKRKVAQINSETGELTIYGNGIIQITAADVESLTCARLMVQVNMQIEGEYADESNGVNLKDAQSGASGGFNVGDTGNAWYEYKSVKLSNLESIVARMAGKNAGTVYISLDKSNNPDKVVAQANVSGTGGWSSWSDISLTLNNEILNKIVLDGTLDTYGCATVYVQSNGINLDYFRLNYIENNDEIPYVIEKTINKTNSRMKATLKYRGSTLATDVLLVAEVLDTDGNVKSESSTTVCGTGEYELETGAVPGEIVRLTIRTEDGNDLSESVEKEYKEPVDSEIVVYTLDSKEYDYTVLSEGADGEAYSATVNGLSGYGGWVIKNGSAPYTYLDVNEKAYEYSFTQAWQAGSGNETKRSLYFTPKSECRVTVLFNGAEGRDMYISQNGQKLATGLGCGQTIAFSTEITDLSTPVYVYGGSSNKQLYAIIVEYYGKAETPDVSGDGEDIAVQYAAWGNSNMVLTKNDVTGETKVWSILPGDIRVELATEYFAEADVPYSYGDKFTINALAEYKDRLYAGCDDGLVIVFTECAKCYKLKKAVDFDIKTMSIEDGYMTVSDGGNEETIDMSVLGGDAIEADEAWVLVNDGAVLVDVRSAEEFAEKSVDGSVNIPVDQIEAGLEDYDKDAVLIFYCGAGTRAEKALETAKALGYTNVYNLGSIDKLM